jgi:hypothetical protein
MQPRRIRICKCSFHDAAYSIPQVRARQANLGRNTESGFASDLLVFIFGLARYNEVKSLNISLRRVAKPLPMADYLKEIRRARLLPHLNN